MPKTNRPVLVAVILLLVALAAVPARAQQAPAEPQPPVYTICTLLVGSAPPPMASGMEGARSIMTAFGGVTWSAAELEQYSENLADLQEKLKSAFHVEQIDVVSSYGDWMSPGRQMVLEGSVPGLKLVVTAGGAWGGAENDVTVRAGDGARSATVRPKANAIEYTLSLTQGSKPLFTKTWMVAQGTRSVFARQVEAGGALYFIVLAVPRPGSPMRTTFGWEMAPSATARVSGAEVLSPRGGLGTGSGAGIGTGHEIRAPKKVSGAQPALPADARAAGLKGPVILSGTIAADGSVQNVKVVKSAAGLDDTAIAAFRTWRYEPPALDKDGKPASLVITVVFPFKDEPDDDQ